jgi:Uma2 family endonuclease
MKTVVLGDPPPVLVSLIAERRRLGQDTHDEVWNGEYHMAPAPSFAHARCGLEFNLGSSKNFRVPDLGVHRGQPSGVWIETAAIVVEVRSPDDESYEKFEFYAEHGVEEILIADLATRTVTWFVRSETEPGFVATAASAVLGLTAAEIAAALNWVS